MMRKFYLIIIALVVASSSFAQQVNANAKKSPFKHKMTNSSEKTVQSVVWEENFDTWPPTNLTISSGAQSTVTDANAKWHDASGAAEIQYVDASMEDEWMTSSAITLPSGTVKLRFDWLGSYYWHVDPNDGADVSVKVSTDGGSNWTDVWIDDDQAMIEAAGGPWPYDNFVQYTATVDISAYAGQSVMIAFQYLGDDGAQWKFDNISIFDLDPIDAELVSINFPNYVLPNTDVDIKGTVKNNGADAITSFDVDYSINGGASVGTFSVTGINVAYGETYDFTHNIAFNQSTEAVYTIEVTVSNVNGGTDATPANNIKSKDIEVNSAIVPRTVLIEQFTTEQCPNCPPVLGYMEGIYDNDTSCLMLTHHAGYYTDFLTIQLHSDMLDFFNDGGNTYAPGGMVDRSYTAGGSDPGPVFWDGNPYGGDKITEREGTASFVNVNICGSYDQTTREFTGKVYGNFTDDYTDMGTALFVSEDHIAQQNQASAPAGFEHRYTARAAVSDRLGDVITGSTTAGSTYEKEYTTTMDAGWAYDNLYLVAFVAHMNASDVNDREIANATQVKLSDIPACQVGISTIENSSINIFPNPSTGLVNVKGAENSTIEILNSLGQVILTVNNASNMESVNLSTYNEGTYIVRVITNNNITVKKINIVK